MLDALDALTARLLDAVGVDQPSLERTAATVVAELGVDRWNRGPTSGLV